MTETITSGIAAAFSSAPQAEGDRITPGDATGKNYPSDGGDIHFPVGMLGADIFQWQLGMPQNPCGLSTTHAPSLSKPGAEKLNLNDVLPCGHDGTENLDALLDLSRNQAWEGKKIPGHTGRQKNSLTHAYLDRSGLYDIDKGLVSSLLSAGRCMIDA